METVEFKNRNFTILEAADHLRVSRSMVYRLIESKQLAPSKIGSRTIITGAELLRCVEGAAAS
jgi:excisionase family DNA binding protein